MSSHTCSLCGLRYPAQPLLDLHIREDHAPRAVRPATPATPAGPATPAAPATPATPAGPATPATPAGPATPATPAGPATPATPADTPAPPGTERPGWAGTAWRALTRMMGREPADRPRRAA